MARVSGNINPNGTTKSNTSSTKNGFSSEYDESKDLYIITFDKPFREYPTVLVNVTNQDVAGSENLITVGIVQSKTLAKIQFGKGYDFGKVSFSFAAFGDLT